MSRINHLFEIKQNYFVTYLPRNNNSQDLDVQAIQQQNINLKSKLKSLETQLSNLKV